MFSFVTTILKRNDRLSIYFVNSFYNSFGIVECNNYLALRGVRHRQKVNATFHNNKFSYYFNHMLNLFYEHKISNYCYFFPAASIDHIQQLHIWRMKFEKYNLPMHHCNEYNLSNDVIFLRRMCLHCKVQDFLISIITKL